MLCAIPIVSHFSLGHMRQMDMLSGMQVAHLSKDAL